MVHVSVCGAYVLNRIHGTNVNLPDDDDIEMSKHVGMYEGCSKSIGPLVGKNTIIYLDV